jgi:hypothetical protein
MSIFSKLLTRSVPVIEFVIPLVCFLIAACFLPDYVQSAFADPFGVWLLGAMFLWNCIGLVLSFTFPQNFVKVIVGLIFCLPLSAFTFFVPATVAGLHSCVNLSG